MPTYTDLVTSAENRHFLARSATIVYTAMYEGHGDSCSAPTIYYRSPLTATRGKCTILNCIHDMYTILYY